MPEHVHRHVHKAFFACLLFAAFCCVTITAQTVLSEETAYRIAYHMAMPNPRSHLFEIRIEVETSEPKEYVDFQMPRWSPGRYGVFEFAKNVQEASATAPCVPLTKCAAPRALGVARLDMQTWRVESPMSRKITLTYKVFGDDLSGTFSQLDERHANYNGASVFMYIVNHKQDPVKLTIEPPPDWRIVNGYSTGANQREWEFANYDIMIDTPTEIAPDWTMDEFKVDGKLYRVVVHSFGEEAGKRPALVRDIEKIVRAETAMWGAPDFDSYTFLVHFAPNERSGDGMEHLTSTQIINTCALASGSCYQETLGTASHEFFHVWNVKRLRPVELGPWDFTKPLQTRALWIAEGFTNYYGQMLLRRAGLWDDEQLFHSLSGTITGIENSPGSRLMSAEEASVLAPFLDRAGHEQRTNLFNTSISYYPKGELVGLVLDLLIRGRSEGRASLDDVMRRMYDEFYVRSPKATYYLKGRGYTVDDFARVTSEVAGTDMSDFFKRHVRAPEALPYDEAFAHVGLKLVRRAAREPVTAGIATDPRERQDARIVSIEGDSAAERGGLRQGDVLVSVGKTSVTNASWRSALNIYKRGETVPVTVRRARQTVSVTIKLDAPERQEYIIEEIKDASPEKLARRAAWLK
jgi:predicted metalloprotease with PDZ domain